jgi:hypothetical protein
VEYAGPALGFTGLDHAHVVIPPSLSGSGMVILTMTVVVNGSVVGPPANANPQNQSQVAIRIRNQKET